MQNPTERLARICLDYLGMSIGIIEFWQTIGSVSSRTNDPSHDD